MFTIARLIASVLCLAAMVLLILCSISSPVIQHFTLLHGEGTNGRLSVGIWGYCTAPPNGPFTCTSSKLGYTLLSTDIPGPAKPNTTIIREPLTKAYVLFPIVTGYAGLASLLALVPNFLLSFFGLFMTASSFAVTFAVWMVAIITNSLAMDKIGNQLGGPVKLGNAIWFGLAAYILLFVAQFFFFTGMHSTRLDEKRYKESLGHWDIKMKDREDVEREY